MRFPVALSGLVVLVACQPGDLYGPGAGLPAPTGLSYQVEPSGVPGEPAGVVLRWDDSSNPDLDGWNVYGRDGTSGNWLLRGTTISNSWHDNGQPYLQYYVTAIGIDNSESDQSQIVTVDERLALAKPNSLTSVSLNGAIALVWSDNAYTADPDGFAHYRVYSASYDIDRDLCGTTWKLEGTTVAPEFRVGAMANGVARCFAVAAISIEGFESLWSPKRGDTPRPDARNVAVTVRQANDQSAGFRFWRDLDGDGKVQPTELGRTLPGGSPEADFAADRDANGRIYLTPTRQGTSVALYGNHPVGDLTEIDLAPTNGYSRTPVEAVPGWGYVFQMAAADQFYRYGAVRVSHVGRDLIIFDWAFQTDPGNPELIVAR